MNNHSDKAPYCFLYRNKPPEFIVKAKGLLSDKELHRIARATIQLQQDRLFQDWMVKNPSWRGKVSTKKRALLNASPLQNPVILEASDPIVVSKGIRHLKR